jgi:hypothetical protein
LLIEIAEAAGFLARICGKCMKKFLLKNINDLIMFGKTLSISLIPANLNI